MEVQQSLVQTGEGDNGGAHVQDWLEQATASRSFEDCTVHRRERRSRKCCTNASRCNRVHLRQSQRVTSCNGRHMGRLGKYSSTVQRNYEDISNATDLNALNEPLLKHDAT